MFWGKIINKAAAWQIDYPGRTPPEWISLMPVISQSFCYPLYQQSPQAKVMIWSFPHNHVINRHRLSTRKWMERTLRCALPLEFWLRLNTHNCSYTNKGSDASWELTLWEHDFIHRPWCCCVGLYCYWKDSATGILFYNHGQNAHNSSGVRPGPLT